VFFYTGYPLGHTFRHAGYPPFQGNTTRETFQRILSAPINMDADPWPHVSAAGKDLVRRMLTRDPSQRITPAEVLMHPWLSQQGVAPGKYIVFIVRRS
jgi:calcium-dependent protein kinase